MSLAGALDVRGEKDLGPEAGRGAGAGARRQEKVSWRQRRREDVEAMLARDPSAMSPRDVRKNSTGLHAIWAFRRQHWLWEHGLTGLAMFLARRSRKRYGIEIHPAATIGRRFLIDHGMGIVIGQTAIIGDDCLLYQGVTLGMTGHHGGKRHPTLGDNVMVGANATILGDIRVGDNVKVGAGAVVVHDVPANVTVAGVPATIVRDHRCWEAPHLTVVPSAEDLDNENVRWSCAL